MSLDPPPGRGGFSVAYEMLETAHYWRIDWPAFDALEGDEQALYIAHYRTARRFQSVDAWMNRPKEKPTTGSGRRRRRR